MAAHGQYRKLPRPIPDPTALTGQQPAQPDHRDHADGGVADRGPDRTNDRLQVGDQRGAITWTALEPKLAPMT